MKALRIAVIGCAALGACAFTETTTGAWGFCAPPEALPRSWREDPAPLHASRVERIAALLGISDEAHQDDGPDRVAVLERLELTRAVLESTVAELDCERERAAQIASSLHAKKERLTTRFTISSIVVGAATTIASGFLLTSNTTSQGVVAVSGGALTAGLALVPLFDHPRVEIKHERNALADIWLGPRVPATFPTVVWSYLSRPEFSNDQTKPIRVNIVARWKEHDLHGDASDTALLFGPGGRYDAAHLDLRAAMLDQVKAEVRLLNQDLAALALARN